jgi:hypothetical protein
MIPTPATGPDGGHSLYCLSDVDGCLITEDLYWDFSAAMQAAVEQSGTHEVWTEQVLVVGFPPSPVVPPPNLQEVGQVAAIVLRKVVFSPATGQALEPTIHPTPWGKLETLIGLQDNRIRSMGDAVGRLVAMELKEAKNWHEYTLTGEETETEAADKEEAARDQVQYLETLYAAAEKLRQPITPESDRFTQFINNILEPSLQDRIKAQSERIDELQTALAKTLELTTSALEQVHLIDAPGVPGEIGWNVYPQIQALEELTTTVKQIDIPF